MKFGKVENLEIVDFTVPQDQPDTKTTLLKYIDVSIFEINVGYEKWNKNDLKGFYPNGIKHILTH